MPVAGGMVPAGGDVDGVGVPGMPVAGGIVPAAGEDVGVPGMMGATDTVVIVGS